ncbi:MAG TPA: hypothetical protein VK215_04590 [Acidimicrobiales bacterium]|nr:hypothetical protein [Acidimicrobiales bacterium]HLN41702.1 hypothetical protein [Acidimicrobiales bacterium]
MAAPEVDQAADEVWFVEDDIFIKAKSNRRDRLPVSLRQGRHVAKSTRRERRRSSVRSQVPQRMHLVDGDHLDGLHDGHGGDHQDHDHHDHAETTRIALRLSFEDFSGAHDASEARESVAG